MILPSYTRRSKSIETLLPILYLKGISAGDFSEALAPCSARMRQDFLRLRSVRWRRGHDDHAAWVSDFSAKRYVYVWADGFHLQARLREQ